MTKRDELIALGGVGVKVRELEWRRIGDCWKADRYSIRIDHGVPVYYVVSGWDRGTNPHDTLDAAKAAAQADYERRILSALEAPAAGDGEPVAWQFLCADGVWRDCLPPPEYDLKQNKGRFRQLYTAPPADAAMREALDAEELYLLEHFGSDADIMPGDIEGAFHRLRETLTAPGATTKSDGGGGSRPALKEERIETTTVHEDRTTSLAAVRQMAGVAPGPSDPSSTRSEVTALVDREWQSLLDKDDRTSPEEYSDMCLITREELHGIVNTALLETHEIRRK